MHLHFSPLSLPLLLLCLLLCLLFRFVPLHRLLIQEPLDIFAQEPLLELLVLRLIRSLLIRALIVLLGLHEGLGLLLPLLQHAVPHRRRAVELLRRVRQRVRIRRVRVALRLVRRRELIPRVLQAICNYKTPISLDSARLQSENQRIAIAADDGLLGDGVRVGEGPADVEHFLLVQRLPGHRDLGELRAAAHAEADERDGQPEDHVHELHLAELREMPRDGFFEVVPVESLQSGHVERSTRVVDRSDCALYEHCTPTSAHVLAMLAESLAAEAVAVQLDVLQVGRDRNAVIVLARASFRAAAAREVDAEPRLLAFGRRFVGSRVARVARHVAARRRRLALLHAVRPVVSHPATVPDVVLVVPFAARAVRSDPFHLLPRRAL